jgi:hypothetical protein
VWLVPVAYLPQLIAFQFPATRGLLSKELAVIALVSSQALLLIFALVNLHRPGFWLLGLGLALNLVVIVLNGGLMPISPETLSQMIPEVEPGHWQVGERFGTGKDIILSAKNMQLQWLADRILLPGWFPYRAAYSIGDMLIAAGILGFLWSAGRKGADAVVHLGPDPMPGSIKNLSERWKKSDF